MTVPVIACVGLATIDTIALVPHYPASNERVEAREIVVAGGGPAATAAVTIAKLGMRAAFIGRVGADSAGDRILAELKDHGIDVSGVAIDQQQPSAASTIVVDEQTADRAICTRPQPRLTIDPGSAAADVLGQADWVHVDHLGWPAISNWLGEAASPLLSVDAGNPLEEPDLGKFDLYVPTLSALADRYRPAPARTLIASALAEGARAVVATDGSRGSWGMSPGQSLHHVPALQVNAVSTLGAGDVYHGALVAGIASTLPLNEAMRLASAIAALSCRALDGRSAIPTAEEFERIRANLLS